jgi:competence protein ComEA
MARHYASALRYDSDMVGAARFVFASAGAVVLTAIASAQTPQATDPRFPDGVGKTALFRVCSECHGPESAVGQLKTRDEWRKTLDEMGGYGAQGTDEEWTQILEYLVKNFSLIAVNKATAAELANTLDVSPSVAESIVRYRDEHGRLSSIDDLKKVPGIDSARIEAHKDRLVF